MHNKMKQLIKLFLLVVILLLPITAWTIYKPVRVLVPDLVSDITCVSQSICTDDASKYLEAKKLYDEAIQFVTSSVGVLRKKPRIIFCSKESCFRSFGFNKAAAQTVGTSGIVVSPRGWKYYYIRHEIIHHLQSERLGIIKQWHNPAWLKEGMAYSLSGDPRITLSDPHQEYRTRFAQWYKTIDATRLWEAARKL